MTGLYVNGSHVKGFENVIKIIKPKYKINSDYSLVKLLNLEVNNYCIFFNNRIFVFESLEEIIKFIRFTANPAYLGSSFFYFSNNSKSKITEYDDYELLSNIHKLKNMELLALVNYITVQPVHPGMPASALREPLENILEQLKINYPEHLL